MTSEPVWAAFEALPWLGSSLHHLNPCCFLSGAIVCLRSMEVSTAPTGVFSHVCPGPLCGLVPVLTPSSTGAIAPALYLFEFSCFLVSRQDNGSQHLPLNVVLKTAFSEPSLGCQCPPPFLPQGSAGLPRASPWLLNTPDAWLTGPGWCPALSQAEVGLWGPRHKANQDVFLEELLKPFGAIDLLTGSLI